MILRNDETFGFLRLGVDVHTLGISALSQLLEACRYRMIIADDAICSVLRTPDTQAHRELIAAWIEKYRITQLGVSYRLDPQDGARLFSQLLHGLRQQKQFAENGGRIRGLLFGGLPDTCRRVREEHGDRVTVFIGDESPIETLRKIGVPAHFIPVGMSEEAKYDDSRLAFAREIVASEEYRSVDPVDRSNYQEYGTKDESLILRLRHSSKYQLPPLIRAHVGPYLSNRFEAMKLFLNQVEELAESGYLDILSIGTSQLSQSRFGEEWGNSPNGGGVPINSREEYTAVRRAAEPMLVRTYSGTQNVRYLASVYEETLNMAWHALSLWWFNKMDGRGPLSVYETLVEHLDTIQYIASTGKPFEANVSHHFAFRGSDDISYVLSAYLAAKAAKLRGIRYFVLQNMLNTPKGTWGIADLAKSRATLGLLGELVDENFRVILQPGRGAPPSGS